MPQPPLHTQLPGDPPVTVRLRPDPRARRISLRVAHADGRVTLTFPPRAGREAALDFMATRAGWLRATLADLPQAVAVRPGMEVPILGVATPLVAAPLRRARAEGGVLLVPAGAACGPAVAQHLRGVARARLEARCRAHAPVLGRAATAFAVRDTRGRWGSCTAAGRVMISWRLALAPAAVFDYVAAHEAAHLLEMNHAPAFWRVVARLCPDWRDHRAWLRAHGAGLHRWRFGD